MADADDDDDDFLLELLMHKKSNADSAMPTHTAALCSKCLGLKTNHQTNAQIWFFIDYHKS